MKMYLTGSSGFVSKNLLKYLKGSVQYKCLKRHEFKDITNIQFDFGSSIVHLAGKAHDLKKVADPQEYYQVNFEITRDLYEAFLKSDAKKFIFISSVKASADKVDGVLTEEHHSDPKTHYGKSKLIAEQYIQAQVLPKGKSYYILRPCMVHGPSNKGNLNLLYQIVKKGIPWPLAAFENQRSFLSVENLCFVIKELIENEIPSGVYQIADDESLSTNELVKEIGFNLGLKPKLWAVPAGLIQTIAKLGDRLKLPLNTDRLNKLTENYIVSNYKIKAALGKELPIKARDGLKKTIESFKNVV